MSDRPQDAEDMRNDKFFANGETPDKQPVAEVSPVLRNWQVLEDGVEIEGEATTVADPLPADRAPAQALHEASVNSQIADQQDPALIALLDERQLQVCPGEEAIYTLTLLNNGAHAGLFTVTVEGWIDERWLLTPPPTVDLAPGERRTVTVTLQPPRTTRTHAGLRALAFCIRADSYPGRCTRLGATLAIEPYSDLRIGAVQPAQVTLSWWQPAATLTLPLINRSNHALTVRLTAHDREQQCRFTISLPGSTPAVSNPATPNLVKLLPGQHLQADVQVRLRNHPRWRSHPVETPLQLRVAATDAALPVRKVDVALTAVPLVGLWQLTSLVGVGAVLLAAVGVAGLSALLFVAIGLAQPETPPLEAQMAPPVVIFVQSPLPERQTEPIAATTGATVLPSPTLPAVVVQSSIIQVGQDVRDPAAPLVSAEEVSAPGAAVTTAVPGAAEEAAPGATPVTYGAMFQEIGLRYDLNWRLLAAQAYVESGFDSLALGQHGDLGLMQILPSTWREWAPKVAANDPFDSYSNVLVAAAYSDYLRSALSKRGYSQPQWTLVAYNWGLDKVLDHLASGKGWDDLDPVRQRYATEIIRLAETINTN